MKIYFLILTFSLTGCGIGIFETQDAPNAKHFSAKPTQTSLDTIAESATQSDALNEEKLVAGENGDNTEEGSEITNQEKPLTPEEQRAAEIMRRCPAMDPVILEQLIASGQPFEVECEMEIEVGPDNDNDND